MMKNTLNKKRLYEELMKLNLTLPPRKSESEIRKITDLYFEDLKGKSEIYIIAAVAAVRKKAHFFPLIKEILDEYNLITSRIKDNKPMLQGPKIIYLSPEENIKHARALKKKLRMFKNVPLAGLSKAEKKAHQDRIFKQRDDINEGRISI